MVVMILSGSVGKRYIYGVLAGPKVITDALPRSSEHHILFAALRNSHFALATEVSRFSTLEFWSLGNDDEVKDSYGLFATTASRQDKGGTPGALHVTPCHGRAT